MDFGPEIPFGHTEPFETRGIEKSFSDGQIYHFRIHKGIFHILQLTDFSKKIPYFFFQKFQTVLKPFVFMDVLQKALIRDFHGRILSRISTLVALFTASE